VGQREAVVFSETQTVRQRFTAVLLAFPPAALVFITCRQVIWHKPWGTPPSSDGGLIFLTVLLVAVYIRLITVKMVTELRPHEVVVELRGLWRRRQIPLEEVVSAEPVSYDPVADFGGYGIRTGRLGTAYIARGNSAVYLVVGGGQRILIGSQHAAELARKIMELRKR
jgi:hypothetical protein